MFFFSLGSFQVDSENYENVKTSIKEILDALKHFTEIEINKTQYKVIKYFGGDLKFLATMYGINAANSKFPCVWCEEFNSQSQVDLAQQFKITRYYNNVSN